MKYCCEVFKRAIEHNAIQIHDFMDNVYWILEKVDETHTHGFQVTYCPFCGKQIRW